MSLSRDILLTEEDIEKYCKEKNKKLNIKCYETNNAVIEPLNTLIEYWKREFRPIYRKIDEANLS